MACGGRRPGRLASWIVLPVVCLQLVLASAVGLQAATMPGGDARSPGASVGEVTDIDSLPYVPIPKYTYVLEELVVTASRIREPVRTAPVSVAVISADEIVDSGSDLLSDVLDPIAGVNVARYGWVGQLCTGGLRGSTYQQVLYLYDGRPLYDPHTGGFDLSQTAINGFERIETLLGGASSLYGANALGGVVNLIPKVFDGDVPYTKVALERGTYNTSFSQLEFGTQLSERLDVYVTGEYRTTDGFRENSDSKGRSASARARYWLNNQLNLNFSINRFNGELGVPGSLTWPSSDARQRDNRVDVDIGLQGEIGSYGYSKLNLYGSDIWYRYDDAWGMTSHTDFIGGGVVQHTFPEWRGQRLTLGAEGEMVEARINAGDEDRTHREGLYVRGVVRPIPRLSLVAGGRYDHHSQYGSHLSPSLNAGYEIGPMLLAFAGYDHSYKAPTLNDLDPRWNGDPDLKPEQADAVQVGIREQGLLPVEAQVTVFARRTSDEIIWVTDDGFNWYPRNIGRTEAKGLEVSLRGELGAGFSGSAAYAYADVRNRETQKLILYRPQHRVSGHLQYRRALRHDRVHLTLRIGGLHVGERYADNEESTAVESLTLVNGRAVLKIVDVSLYYEIDNLLDTEYQYIFDYPMPRRTTSIGIAWEFWD